MFNYRGFDVVITEFPDATPLIKIDMWSDVDFVLPSIYWKYENMAEMATLIFVAKKLKSMRCSVELIMPYIPNARMDRVKNANEVFTLKYFADIVNSLGFEYVTVLDPHSSVSEALIDNVRVINAARYIAEAYRSVTEIERVEPMLVFPDEGAMKRYSDILPKSEQLSCVFGIKRRDWDTGKILGVQIIGDVTYDRPILIIDDISSYGGTFYYVGNKLKEMGVVKNIYLYVTHCENSILKGKLFDEGIITGVYTTSSLFSGESDKIKVFDLEGDLF